MEPENLRFEKRMRILQYLFLFVCLPTILPESALFLCRRAARAPNLKPLTPANMPKVDDFRHSQRGEIARLSRITNVTLAIFLQIKRKVKR